MRIDRYRNQFAAAIGEVDEKLWAYTRAQLPDHDLFRMIQYHLGFANPSLEVLELPDAATRGKRMRSILCLLIGETLGTPPEVSQALTLAAEMMHAGSLVHDDIQDKDPVRWGRSTVWMKFGVPHAINVGDAMVALTYRILRDLADLGVSPAVVLDVLSVFNEAHLRMTEGQHADIALQGRLDVTVPQYLDLISGKTAAACECVCRASALLGAGEPRIVEAFTRFGHALGMLYQICDDMASVWLDQCQTGKKALQDVCLGKPVLPIICALERDPTEFRRILTAARLDPDQVDLDRDMIRALLRRLGVDQVCREHATRYAQIALDSVDAAGVDPQCNQMLKGIVHLCSDMGSVL